MKASEFVLRDISFFALELPVDWNVYDGMTYIAMPYQAWNPYTVQRAKRRLIRRHVRNVVAILAIVFGSMDIAALAWLVFVRPYV